MELKKQEQYGAPSERYHALDVLRGFCLVLMLVHHTLFDLQEFGVLELAFLDSTPFLVIQTFFASCFVILAGASCNFSRNNKLRAIIMIMVALGISGFTLLFAPNLVIRFGIVHMMGFSTLIYSIAGKWLSKIPFPVWLLLFALTWNIPRTYSQIGGLWWLGIRTASFSSADYYPLLPWFFMYMFGVWFGKLVKGRKLPGWFYTLRCAPLEKLSHKSMMIFLVHQPALFFLVGTLADVLNK